MVASAQPSESVAAGLGRVVLSATMLASALSAGLLIANLQNGGGLSSVAGAALLALVAVAVAAGIRLATTRIESRFAPWELRAILIGPSCVLLALAVLAMGKETPTSAVILVWTAFAAEEIWWWLRAGGISFASASGRSEVPVSRLNASDGVVDVIPIRGGVAEDASDEGLSPDLVQRMTRRIDGDVESIVCLMRATFEPGQRQASLHASFCPPLEAEPSCECEQVEGPEAVLKLTQAESFGARVDLRLSRGPETEVAVVVRITASSTSPA